MLNQYGDARLCVLSVGSHVPIATKPLRNTQMKHMCRQHRPVNVFEKTERSTMKHWMTCNYYIYHKDAKFEHTPEKYRRFMKYSTYYPDWHIETSNARRQNKFWQWLYGKYSAVTFYDKPTFPIPPEWKDISKDTAEKSLSALYNRELSSL